MENITSTIERIKYQEQQNDTASFLNAAICDATVEAKKSEREQERLIKSTDSLRRQKMLLECRRDALSAHVNSLKKELTELRTKANEDISKVWEMRSSFCKDIYASADACDVWSLLMKPACAEPMSRNVQKEKLQVPTASENENRLQVAIERRAKALAERDRLATEPDNGEEFMRIKDALRYSLDRIAEMNK